MLQKGQKGCCHYSKSCSVIFRNKRMTEIIKGNAIKNNGVDIGSIYWKI